MFSKECTSSCIIYFSIRCLIFFIYLMLSSIQEEKNYINISLQFKQNINALKSILEKHIDLDLNHFMTVNVPVFASAVAHLYVVYRWKMFIQYLKIIYDYIFNFFNNFLKHGCNKKAFNTLWSRNIFPSLHHHKNKMN